jgi:pimeloyl-ACP methyl ester carboxylesterase
LLPSAWRNVRVKALARGGLEFLDVAALNADLAALRRRGDVIRKMVTIGSTNHVFGLSEQTGLPLISIDKGVSKPVGVSATSLTDPMILSDAKGGSTLLHVGYTPKLSDDGSRLPYIRPLIDHATGSVIGRFGQRDIAFEPGHFAEPRSLQAWIGDGWIVDAAADGNFLTLLIRNPDRSMRLVHGKKGGISSTPVCEDRNFIVDERLRLKSVPADPRRLQAVADLDVRTWNPDRSEADPTMPIGQLYTKKGAHKAQLLVYFHGGPASSLWNVGIPKIVEELSGPNRTILTVETSGSTGAGLPLAQALARFGPAAIERDVRLVADWAKSQNYRDVQIVAESFGAVSALAAIQADPSLFKRAYFIAPLIRLRDPMEWTGRGRSVPNTAHQLASEHAMFGGPAGREKMRAWLETHWTSYARGRDDRFYFAAADDVSKPSDMPGAARPDLQMTVYKGTNHEFISGRPEIWADIRSALDAPLEVQGPTKAQAVPKPVVSRRGSTPALRKAVSQRELTSQS